MRTHKKYTYNPKNGNNSAILNHINCKKCVGKEENFQIIGSAQNDYHLCLKESLLIQKLKPKINTNENSVPLKLFWFFLPFFSLISFYLFTDFIVCFLYDIVSLFIFLVDLFLSFLFLSVILPHPSFFFFDKKEILSYFTVNSLHAFN